MAILNYTTKIASAKTVGEIQEILGRKGAKTVSLQYDGGKPSAVMFSLEINGVEVGFRLPCKVAGVHAAFQKDTKIPNQYCSIEQAERTAWRIIKDWVEAQMAIVEAGQAKMEEVFMPYALHESGETMFQRFESHQRLLPGKKE